MRALSFVSNRFAVKESEDEDDKEMREGESDKDVNDSGESCKIKENKKDR